MGIRIDALDAAASAQADHEIPAMRDGATVKLTAQQLATFIVALVTDSAPSTLDTLNELAAALGDDPNFATTVTNAIAGKATLLSSGTSDDTFSDSDELAYVTGTTQKRGTVTGLKANLLASTQTWTAKQTFQNAGFTTNPVDLAVGQIAFPATQNPSTNVNTLDDYEEGAWTPTLTPNVGSITTSSASGSYTKIGNRVFFSVQVTIVNAGTGAGGLTISLPFTASGIVFAAGANASSVAVANGVSLNTASFVVINASGGTIIVSGTTWYFNGHYVAA